MKTVQEILESTETIGEAIDAMVKQIGENPPNPMEAIQSLERFAVRGIEAIGLLALQMADELGALPNGLEEEFGNLKTTILFHKLAAVTEILQQRNQGEGLLVAKPTLVVPK